MSDAIMTASDMKLIQDISELIEKIKGARASACYAMQTSQELKIRYEVLTNKYNPIPNQ